MKEYIFGVRNFCWLVLCVKTRKTALFNLGNWDYNPYTWSYGPRSTAYSSIMDWFVNRAPSTKLQGRVVCKALLQAPTMSLLYCTPSFVRGFAAPGYSKILCMLTSSSSVGKDQCLKTLFNWFKTLGVTELKRIADRGDEPVDIRTWIPEDHSGHQSNTAQSTPIVMGTRLRCCWLPNRRSSQSHSLQCKRRSLIARSSCQMPNAAVCSSFSTGGNRLLTENFVFCAFHSRQIMVHVP